MNRLLTLLGVALTAIALGATLNAATVTWDGGGDGTTWSDPDNWDTSAVPTATDEAVFDGSVAPTTVTGVSNTVQRIQVDSGANPALSIAFELSGNVTLVGLAGNALYVGAGDAVTFRSTSATVQTLDIQADLDSAGSGASYTFESTVTLQTSTNGLSLTVRDDSTLNVQGILAITSYTDFPVNNTSTTTVVSFNDLDLGEYFNPYDTGGTPVVTVAGDITYSAANSAWDDGSVNTDFVVNLNGSLVDFNSFDNLEFDFDQSSVVVGGNLVLQDVSGITSWNEPPRFNYLTVSAGASLTMPDGLPTSPALFVNEDLVINGTWDIGDNELVLYGSLWTVGAGGVFQQGAGTPGTVTLQGNILITGEFTIPGNLYCWQDSFVSLGSDLTVDGNLTINGSDFGADEDGSATTDMATLRINGTLATTATGRYAVGEGLHYFGGDIDLSATDDRVAPPSGANTEPEIHFTGGAQALSFSSGGSFFMLNSVASTTSITHDGLCLLVGDMDLSGSTQTDVWTSTTGSNIQIGDGDFGVQGELKMGNANANFNEVRVLQVINGDINDHTEYTFSRDAGMTGVINLAWYLVIEGDSNDDSGTGTSTIEEESNAGILTISGADVYLDETVIDGSTAGPIAVHILDGESDSVIPASPPPPPPADWEGNGAELHLENGAILRAPNIKVGVASMTAGAGMPAPPITEHMGSKFFSQDSTLDYNLSGVGNGLDAGHYAIAEFVNTTVQGQGSFKLVTVPETYQTTLLNCNIDRGTSVGGTPNVTVLVGGLNVTVVGNTISGLSGTGFWIRPNAVVRAFNENTFLSNTLQGGGVDTHITLQGLGTGSAQYWDNNHFDNSVNTGSGGLFVDVMSGSNPVEFRIPAGSPNGFGVTGFNVTAAQAETYDNDGAASGTDVTWNDAANELTAIDEGAALPAGLITNSSTLHQTALLFGLNALSGNHTVDEVTIAFDVSATALAESDIQSATLFNDSNQNGTYDTGEEFAAATLNQSLTGSDVVFDLVGAGVAQAINSGNMVHWGVSIRFAASGNGLAGTLRTILQPGGVVLSNPASGIVSGLPVFSDLTVTGPPAGVLIVTQPGGAPATTALTPQPVVEVVDGSGNRVLGDSSTTVTAAIGTDPTGGSILGGTTTVTVVDGLATFTNLSINQAGSGFTLDFSSTGLVSATSTTFDITAAPSGGGGGGGDDDDEGCSTGSGNGLWMMLAALAALAVIGIRAARHRA